MLAGEGSCCQRFHIPSNGSNPQATNYANYDETRANPYANLPVDSHELVTLCGPRPVFLSAGAARGDGWVDAKGTFLAGVGAGPVYRLLGRKELGAEEFPPIETALLDGGVAFRQHHRGHTDGPNWPIFLRCADRYVQARPAAWPAANTQ